MEPMNLGSPTHGGLGSPSSPMSPGGMMGGGGMPAPGGMMGGGVPGMAGGVGVGAGGAPGGMGQGYLPGYLMGDPLSPAAPSPINRQISSPGKLSRSQSNMTTSGMNSIPTTPLPYQSSRQQSLFKESLNNSGRMGGRADKTGGGGGPPTVNLMSTVNTPNSNYNSPFRTESSYLEATPGGGGGGASASRILEVTASASSEEADPLSVWVTVFGFPPSATSYVVSQLSHCGTVLSQLVPTNGNWMHLRFQTKLQAKKALSKNGSVIGGTIMIGVRQCSDKTVLEQGNTTCVNASMLDTSCNGSQIANLSTGLGTPRTIRPLTQAFKEAQVENKVVPGINTPNKNDGIVNKALEYMFGW